MEIKLSNNKVGEIEDVIFERVDGIPTNHINHYIVKIDGVSGCIVYPDEIDRID